MALVPVHNLRRQNPDQADLDHVLFTGPVGHFTVEQCVRLIEGVIRTRSRPKGFHKVCTHNRKVSPLHNFIHEINAVVELVVPQRPAIIAEHVHRLNDRVLVPVRHAALVGNVITHRVALQKVTVIDQNRVGALVPHLLDNRRGA